MSGFDACFDAGIDRCRNDGPPAARAARWLFFGVVGIVFIAGTVSTIALDRSMSAMPDIPMPGDWALSAMWIPASTCGQTWMGSAGAFVAMWTVMMIPMMLPSLTPALWGYWKYARRIVGRRAAGSALSVGLGYFFVWFVLGAVAFAVGASLSAGLLRSTVLARSMPVFSGVVIALAGCLQFTPWKAGRLACSRLSRLDSAAPMSERCAAFRHGCALALHGGVCCANWTVVLFCLGVMDLLAMVCVSAAMLIEQFVPSCGRATKSIGLVAIMVGLAFIARAALFR